MTFPATRPVFSDEFNGPAGTKPDAAKWKADTGVGPNNELEYYTDNLNAATDGAGGLVLEARREKRRPPGQYTSARLNTSNSFTFTYGHVEARIKVSGTQGLVAGVLDDRRELPDIGNGRAAGKLTSWSMSARSPRRSSQPCTLRPTTVGPECGSPYTI